jgi:hypothetical protein
MECESLTRVVRSSDPGFTLRGHFMSNDDYALLRTLAARPIAVLLPAIEPRMAVLSAAGYVTRTHDGWIATSTGCSALEAEPGRRSRLPTSWSR